ncbi:hypothetical protein SAMN05428953_13112 [Mesorhizobium muleiense]|uniref:Uncharacterized protein n=1 Tax=Mesorhizobium muleiense TaxID=1004279 RepID=A0A1G9INE6_9HYPH|nr:hypothetical protein SAMN05428953_13112 [Mesorhizobium muleiense]
MTGKRHSQEVEHESDLFYLCPTGQVVDARDLRHVNWHEPLELDA